MLAVWNTNVTKVIILSLVHQTVLPTVLINPMDPCTMTAVSQSYPNYLGGLNEQPDELKKPGQLSEALNVIPDPTIGLTRRPGFELVPLV